MTTADYFTDEPEPEPATPMDLANPTEAELREHALLAISGMVDSWHNDVGHLPLEYPHRERAILCLQFWRMVKAYAEKKL